MFFRGLVSRVVESTVSEVSYPALGVTECVASSA